MGFPRLSIAGLMTLVALSAFNLALIHALHDGLWEHMLFDVLPMANVMALVAAAGLRQRRLRAFALGFVPIGALSLGAFLAWADANPWTFLHYVEPPFQALDRRVIQVLPNGHVAVVNAIAIVTFMIPHVVAGLAGGWLTAKCWASIMRRRHESRRLSGG